MSIAKAHKEVVSITDEAHVKKMCVEFGIKAIIEDREGSVHNLKSDALRGHVVETIISKVEEGKPRSVASLKGWLENLELSKTSSDKIYRLNVALYSQKGNQLKSSKSLDFALDFVEQEAKRYRTLGPGYTRAPNPLLP